MGTSVLSQDKYEDAASLRVIEERGTLMHDRRTRRGAQLSLKRSPHASPGQLPHDWHLELRCPY